MPSPSLEDEVAFISNVKSDGTLALDSFYAWNDDTYPADYSGGYTNAMKWGADTAGTPGGTVSYYFDPASNWTLTEQNAFAAGLALWSAEANISFVQTSDASAAQITFTRGSNGSAVTQPHVATPTSSQGLTGGTELLTMTTAAVTIDTHVAGFGPIGSSFQTYGGYPWETLVHEEGHAIGLGHAGPYNASDKNGTEQEAQFSIYDNRMYSLMSYLNPSDSTAAYYSQYTADERAVAWAGNYPTTPMMLDILAAQRLYGTPVNTPLSGGQVFGYDCNIAGAIEPFFDFTKNTRPVITLWDAGTGNTLDLSGAASGYVNVVNLGAGTFSSVLGLTNNLAIAFGTAIDTFRGGAAFDSVTANNDGDTLYGGAGNDILFGGSGNDILEGDGGNDELSGGAGRNTALYSGARAGYTITRNADGSITISAGTGDSDVLINIQFAQFSDGTVALTTARSDFNADLKSDILMTNPANGQLLIWEMDGTTRLATSGKTSSYPGTNYTIIGTGDFNGDGKADILMQDRSTGHTTIWEMDGTTRLASSGQAGSNQGAAYKALGAADFNGDGKADILWENTTTGQVSVWLMNGTTKLAGANVGAALSSDWTFAGTGDFDGDGKADIVFQNATSGAVKIWLMDGTTKTGGGTLAGTSGAGHQIVGIGDFDGDGKSDLLWENTGTTALSIWFMDGMTRTSHDSIGDAGVGKSVVGVADYNGDGMADILLQTTSSGHLTEWLMNGTTKLSGGGSVSSNPGSTWHVVAG